MVCGELRGSPLEKENMGLDTSHDCWHGPYSSFHKWRVEIARAAGIDLDAMEGFADENPKPWGEYNVIHEILNHSDCEGEIRWEVCLDLSERLEKLIPEIKKDEYTLQKTKSFISGLRAAWAAKENVEFM